MKRFECSDVWGMEEDKEGEYVLLKDIPLDAIRTLVRVTYAEGMYFEAADEVSAWLELEGGE